MNEKVTGKQREKLVSFFNDKLISDRKSFVEVCVSDYFSIMSNSERHYLFRKGDKHEIILFLTLVAICIQENI